MERYCVIGAGPAGLAQARAFRWAGVPFDVLERHEDVGGIWDLQNPGTPMYTSCRFISSRRLSGFLDFPMPRDYPDYPTQAQVLAYLREFRAHTRFTSTSSSAVTLSALSQMLTAGLSSSPLEKSTTTPGSSAPMA